MLHELKVTAINYMKMIRTVKNKQSVTELTRRSQAGSRAITPRQSPMQFRKAGHRQGKMRRATYKGHPNIPNVIGKEG
jgi:hypothetical protein